MSARSERITKAYLAGCEESLFTEGGMAMVANAMRSRTLVRS